MPHDTTSRDEAAAISALLDFGSTTTTAPSSSNKAGTAAQTTSLSSSSSSTNNRPRSVTQPRSFDTTTTSSSFNDGVTSIAVVTSEGSVVSVSGSTQTVPTGTHSLSSSKKRPGPEGVGYAPSVFIAPAPTALGMATTTTPTDKFSAKRARTEANKGHPHGNSDYAKKKNHVIQDCHAVLGDRHCAGRTTIATVILREIKIKYKDKYKGKGVDNWYEEAMAEYYQRVKEKVPGFTQDDYETVLVYSYTPKGRKDKGRKAAAADEVGSSRVEEPNCYKYHTDDFPKYGKAKVPEAVKFFFNSKDAPTLPKEISKYRADYEKLKMGGKQPPPEKMAFFEDFLKFCEENLRKAKDEEMAQQLLHSLNLIPTLRRLWDTLKASTNKRNSMSFTTVAQAVMQANQPSSPTATTSTITPPPPSSLLQQHRAPPS